MVASAQGLSSQMGDGKQKSIEFDTVTAPKITGDGTPMTGTNTTPPSTDVTTTSIVKAVEGSFLSKYWWIMLLILLSIPLRLVLCASSLLYRLSLPLPSFSVLLVCLLIKLIRKKYRKEKVDDDEETIGAHFDGRAVVLTEVMSVPTKYNSC